MATSELVNQLVEQPKKGRRGIRTLKPFQQEQVKQKIQTTQILKRVQNYALGALEMDYGRVQACFKLLEFRLSKALPDEVSQNLAANAVSQIAHAQLLLMAQEMLRQGQIDASTLDAQSLEIAENNCSDAHVIGNDRHTESNSSDEITLDISEQSLTLDK